MSKNIVKSLHRYQKCQNCIKLCCCLDILPKINLSEVPMIFNDQQLRFYINEIIRNLYTKTDILYQKPNCIDEVYDVVHYFRPVTFKNWMYKP